MNKMSYFYVIVMWMFTTLCLSDSFNDFEGFLMPSIGSYLESDSNIAWASALILGVQMKMIMLIQDAEKNENSSSKIYEWLNGVLTMLFWWLIEIPLLPHCALLVLKFLMAHKKMFDSILCQTFLTKKAIYNLTLEI